MKLNLIMPSVREHSSELLIFILFVLLAAGITLLVPLWAKDLVEVVLPKQRLPDIVIHLIIGMIIFLALQSCRFCKTYMKLKITNHWCQHHRNQLFEKMLNLPLLSMGEQKRGDLITRISSDIQVFREGTARGVFVIVPNLLIIIGLLLMMIWHSVYLSLMLLCILPLIAWCIRHFNTKIRKSTVNAQQSLSSLNNLVDEAASGFKEIKSFVNECQVRDRFQQGNTDTLESFNTQDRLHSLAPAITSFVAFAGIAVLMCGAAWIGFNGMLSLGDLTVFLTSLVLMIKPIEGLSDSFGFASRMEAALQRFDEVFQMQEEERGNSESTEILINEGRIDFDHVHYEYPQGFCLTDICFGVLPGETIAIVGPSGGGKTTLINTIPLFLRPQQGRILIDGVDITNYPLSSLRSQIGFVFQEPVLFDATLAENLAFAKPNASMNEIEAASRAAHVHDFAVTLNNGYNTRVGRYAARLSVGQRQRISIARALLADPKILIMDEPTSSLDSESEALIHQALNVLCANRTTVIVAHRLSTVQHADRVVVLDQGKIVEQGTHQELLVNGGVYSRLYTKKSYEATCPVR